jgi:anti-anti-sigma factor
MVRHTLHTVVDDDRVVVAATGEIYLTAAGKLWAELEQHLAPGRLVVVECSGITFVDSQGLGALIQALHKAGEVGATLRLANVPEAVSWVFDLAGVTRLFAIVGDEPEA